MKSKESGVVYYRFAHEKVDTYKTLECEDDALIAHDMKILLAQSTGLEKEFARTFDLKLFLEEKDFLVPVESDDTEIPVRSHVVVQRVLWRQKPVVEHIATAPRTGVDSGTVSSSLSLRPFPPEYLCPLCHHILNTPVVVRCVSKCGLSACRNCVQKQLAQEKSCPFCKGRVQNVITNKALSAIIQQLDLREFDLPAHVTLKGHPSEETPSLKVENSKDNSLTKDHIDLERSEVDQETKTIVTNTSGVKPLNFVAPVSHEGNTSYYPSGSSTFNDNEIVSLNESSFPSSRVQGGNVSANNSFLNEPLNRPQESSASQSGAVDSKTENMEKLLSAATPLLRYLSSKLSKAGTQNNMGGVISTAKKRTPISPRDGSGHTTHTTCSAGSSTETAQPCGVYPRSSYKAYGYEFDAATNSWRPVNPQSDISPCPSYFTSLPQLACKFPFLSRRDFHILRAFQRELHNAIQHPTIGSQVSSYCSPPSSSPKQRHIPNKRVKRCSDRSQSLLVPSTRSFVPRSLSHPCNKNPAAYSANYPPYWMPPEYLPRPFPLYNGPPAYNF